MKKTIAFMTDSIKIFLLITTSLVCLSSQKNKMVLPAEPRFSPPQEVLNKVTKIDMYITNPCRENFASPTFDALISKPEIYLTINKNEYTFEMSKELISNFKNTRNDSSNFTAFVIYRIYSDQKMMELSFSRFGSIRLNRNKTIQKDSAIIKTYFYYLPYNYSPLRCF